jgi:hypothetical protein
MVPSDPIPSLVRDGHAPYRTPYSGAPYASPLCSPDAGFSGFRFIALRRAAAFLFSETEPFARNGLFLSCNGFRFRKLHSRVTGPGLLLRSLACRSWRPFGLRLHSPTWLASNRTASSPEARCALSGKLFRPLCLPPLPSGSFRSLGIKAFRRLRCRPVRLPITPDFRLLPAAVPLLDADCGSSFAIRYVFGG